MPHPMCPPSAFPDRAASETQPQHRQQLVILSYFRPVRRGAVPMVAPQQWMRPRAGCGSCQPRCSAHGSTGTGVGERVRKLAHCVKADRVLSMLSDLGSDSHHVLVPVQACWRHVATVISQQRVVHVGIQQYSHHNADRYCCRSIGCGNLLRYSY